MTNQVRPQFFGMGHLAICFLVAVLALGAGYFGGYQQATFDQEAALIPHVGPGGVKPTAKSEATPEPTPEATPEAQFVPDVIGGTCVVQVHRRWTHLFTSADRMDNLQAVDLGATLVAEVYGLEDSTDPVSLTKDAFAGV